MKSPRIVFVPSYSWDYEGSDWIGAFSTEAKALAALAQACGDECSHDEHYLYAMEIDGDCVREKSREVYKEEVRNLALAARSGGGRED